MNRRTKRWIGGLIVMILCSLIYNIIYYVNHSAWNLDYINIMIIAIISYIIFGLLIYKR